MVQQEAISVHYQLTGDIVILKISGVHHIVNRKMLAFQILRLNTDVKFTDDALLTIVKVPRPFLKLVLTKCVEWADENGVKVITEKEMKIINDKRSEDKK